MKHAHKKRWLILSVLFVALLLGTSGCGGLQASSWTGLTLKDEEIYAADLQTIQVLNTASGDPQRAYPKNSEDDSPGLFYVAPTVEDNYLIAATYAPPRGFLSQASYLVLRIDLETGEEMWRFAEAKGQYIEAGVISGETFIIGNSDGNVYALDVNTGNLKWREPFKTDHRIWAPPLVDGDTLYIGSMDRTLYALNPVDGSEKWSFSCKGAFASTPVLHEGVLYAGTFDNRVYAIDADEGTERWRYPPDEAGDGWFWGSPLVEDGTVYAVDVKGNAYALDSETGTQIWHYALDVPVRAGPAITENGSTLLITGENGTLYALDTADGSEKWSAAGEGNGYVTPIVDGETVYEARIRGSYRVRALELLEGGDGYKQLWIYPRETEE